MCSTLFWWWWNCRESVNFTCTMLTVQSGPLSCACYTIVAVGTDLCSRCNYDRVMHGSWGTEECLSSTQSAGFWQPMASGAIGVIHIHIIITNFSSANRWWRTWCLPTNSTYATSWRAVLWYRHQCMTGSGQDSWDHPREDCDRKVLTAAGCMLQ